VRWVSAGLAVFKRRLPLELLLVKYRLPNGRYVVEIPKGLVMADEDLLEAAIRETVEETCLPEDDIDIVHSIKPLITVYETWLHSFSNRGLKRLYVFVALCSRCTICGRTEEAEEVFFAPVDVAYNMMTKRVVANWIRDIVAPKLEELLKGLRA